MAKGWNPNKDRFYILECDRELPKAEQTRFRFRVLSSKGYYAAQDNLIEFHGGGKGAAAQTAKTALLTGTQERSALLEGIVGVENYYDEDGKELFWPEGTPGQSVSKQVEDARMAFLSTMRPAWRRELAEAIMEGTEPGEAEEKEQRFRGPGESGVQETLPTGDRALSA